MARKSPVMDKGWSWVIVAGLFVGSYIVGGFLMAFGVFFAEFEEKFEASTSATSLILGVRSVMNTIVAPLSTILCDRFSERSILIWSALFNSAGCMAAAFAPNLDIVILAMGVLMGIGSSTFFGPVQIAIGKYFDKRKSIAVSITFSGMCLAQILMSPVNIMLLEEFGLQGALILYSGFLLNIMVGGALVRPRTAEHVKQTHEVLSVNSSVNHLGAKVSVLDLTSLQDLCKSNQTPAHDENHSKSDSFYNDKNIPEGELENGKLKECETSLLTEALPEGELENVNLKEYETSLLTEESVSGNSCENSTVVVDPMPEVRNKNSLNRKTTVTVSRIVRAISSILDFSLLKHLDYAMYAIAVSSALVPFNTLPVYLFPTGLEYGLTPTQSALLLTIMGAADFVSRPLQGLLGDNKKVGPLSVFIGGIFGFGVSAAALPFTRNFLQMAIVSGLIGFFSCTCILLGMPILVEMMGLAKLTKSMALISFLSGISCAVSPPLLGYLKDVTGSYDSVYFVSAGILILSSAIMFVGPIKKRIEGRRKHQSDSQV